MAMVMEHLLTVMVKLSMGTDMGMVLLKKRKLREYLMMNMVMDMDMDMLLNPNLLLISSPLKTLEK